MIKPGDRVLCRLFSKAENRSIGAFFPATVLRIDLVGERIGRATDTKIFVVERDNGTKVSIHRYEIKKKI